MSSTLTSTVWPISSTSDGWLTCDHESSEMWIRPSMPSRSTKAPKSTMLEIWPSTTARRDRTTLFRERLSSITLARSSWPRNSSRSCTRRMSTSDAGRKPRTPRSRMRPPFGVLLGEDEGVDLLAHVHLVLRIDRAPDRELRDRNDALGLVADVHEHLVLVDAHDGAVDDLTFVD